MPRRKAGQGRQPEYCRTLAPNETVSCERLQTRIRINRSVRKRRAILKERAIAANLNGANLNGGV